MHKEQGNILSSRFEEWNKISKNELSKTIEIKISVEQIFWKIAWNYLVKLKVYITCDPKITLLVHSLKKFMHMCFNIHIQWCS